MLAECTIVYYNGKSVASFRKENKSQSWKQNVSTPRQCRQPSTHSNWDHIQKFRTGAASLTTASQQPLSTGTEGLFPCITGQTSLSKREVILCKQHPANSEQWGPGQWHLPVAHEHCQEQHKRERDNCSGAWAGGISGWKARRLKVLSALGTCTSMFHK